MLSTYFIKKLILKISDKKIPIFIGKNIFKNNILKNDILKNKQLVIIIDKKIKKLHPDILKNFPKSLIISLHASEKNKTRAKKAYIEDQMFKNNISKDAYMIAIGGGVILDMASFIAATYKRGIKHILVPTTLISMVDASIGGKAAINTKYGKNLIGSFYQPEKIIIDSFFLSTLSKKELRSGISEIIKYGIILDKKLFDLLLKNLPENLEDIIEICCKWKKEIVKKDEKDKNLRNILNFGHTIAHSIESLDKITHGDALSIGILGACYLSSFLGYLKKEDFFTILKIFKKYKFPLTFSKNISWKQIMEKMYLDKKVKNSQIHFVLLEEIGKIKKNENQFCFPIDKEIIKKTLIWVEKRFKEKFS